MADKYISKINLLGTDLLIKDINARNGVENNATNIANLGTRLTNEITSVNTRITDEISTVNTRIDKLINHKFLFVGDSYSVLDNSWVSFVVEMLGISSSNYANVGVSGASFNDTNNNFITQIINYTGDKSAITDIVVCGGINDALYNSTDSTYQRVIAKMSEFINYAKINYPNAKCHLGYIGGALSASPVLGGRTFENQRWAKWTYIRQGNELGFHILKGVENAIHTSRGNYSTDLLHPNYDGSREIASAIVGGLLTGSANVTYPSISIDTTTSLRGLSLNAKYSVNNDITHICFSDAPSIALAQGSSFTGGVESAIGTLTNTYFNEPIEISCTAQVPSQGSHSYDSYPCVLKFFEQSVYIRFLQMKADGSGYQNLTFSVADTIYIVGYSDITFETFGFN